MYLTSVQLNSSKGLFLILYTQADLSMHTEQKFPWIRRRLKKTSHRVEKNPDVLCCLKWYYKLYESLTGNSFKELEKKVTQLESHEKL